ncbi:hypothetical protein MBLNU230_g1935t1 [Neophaeotheca triangularis]
MATQTNSSSKSSIAERRTKQKPKPRALADLRYNDIIGEATGSSSDDEARQGRIPAEQARHVLGVSIGAEQNRYLLPTTPAAEKQAAMADEGGFFAGALDGPPDTLVEVPEPDDEEVDIPAIVGEAVDEKNESTTPQTASSSDLPLAEERPPRSPRKAQVRLPSPWRAGPNNNFQRTDKRESTSFMDRIPFNRRRASSGPTGHVEDRQSRWAPNFSNFSSLFSNDQSEDIVSRRKRSSSFFASQNFQWPSWGGDSDRENQQSPNPLRRTRTGEGFYTRRGSPQPEAIEEESKATVPDLPSRPQLQQAHSYVSNPRLRRSASADSLITQRTLSRVSSLGDDSRFENVREQVNSRAKAIKDSWQDSNFKLPSVSSLNLSNFTSDFVRSASVSRRSSFRQPKDQPAQPSASGNPKQIRSDDLSSGQRHGSARPASSDAAQDKHQFPYFRNACEQLDGDLVILGGYRGSILRSAEPPHRQLWVPIKVGLNIRKADLEVGFGPDDDEKAEEKIIPGGMLSHIGPVDISRRLFKRLRACEKAQKGKLRVHDYGYDWRLDPEFLSKKMIKFLESLPCNAPGVPKEQRGATVIAHSLGGLITRHAVNQRPELFRGVVYAGVPNTCVNILGPLRNGDEVLLSSKVLTAQVNFSIRTSFALLPLDGRCFFDINTKEEYPVDFFDVNTWIDNRLSPCVARPLPPLHPPPEQQTLTGRLTSMASSLPIPRRKNSKPNPGSDPSKTTNIHAVAEPDMLSPSHSNTNAATALAANNIDRHSTSHAETSPATTVTLPRREAISYLSRTLANIKRFKLALAHNPAHTASNLYPPHAVIYGKSTPTVFGAKVEGREGIKHADAYDNLAFASGDGVVLARAAMVPNGYQVVRGGVVNSERGHVTLLGDLEAVGKCLCAVVGARGRGVGLGGEEGGGEPL